jgi:acyl carrier protein phosphodiesterase
MNYLAHAFLARKDEGLMLGGLLGDHVRGLLALRGYPPPVRRGIRLHRHIDRFTDQHAEVRALLRCFPKPYRRYGGIIIDLAFDHELAQKWDDYADCSLDDFDREVRDLLAQHETMVPPALARFMAYADRRGLFAAYREESELLRSLAGVGQRLRRQNPLHRVGEIWPEVRGPCAETFVSVFPAVQSEVDDWVSRMSTTTGS